MLEIEPKNTVLPPQALERTFLACQSPGQVAARLTGANLRLGAHSEALKASPDGACLYDSAGGEPLAVRLVGPLNWKKFTLYRRVPESGVVNVTLALTGIGKVYFDDVRIEPRSATNAAAMSPTPTAQGALRRIRYTNPNSPPERRLIG